MKLPIEASDDDGILTKNGTMIYGKEDDAVTIGVQPLKDETGNVSFEGVRTLITINESTASKEYTFAYDLPEGYSLITAKDYYCDIIDNEAVNENDYDTGEVYIVNKDNVIDTVIDAAWAVDANGNDVDTYYVVNENILTQVVNFDEKTTFPVIADPSAWKIAKCAAAIGLIVAGTVIAAAKVAKVVKYIKTLGGVKKAAKLVVLAYAAGDAKKYARHIGGSFKNLCEIILGIDIIKSQYTQYRNNVSKKNLFLFITAIILMICVEARYACEKQVLERAVVNGSPVNDLKYVRYHLHYL